MSFITTSMYVDSTLESLSFWIEYYFCRSKVSVSVEILTKVIQNTNPSIIRMRILMQ